MDAITSEEGEEVPKSTKSQILNGISESSKLKGVGSLSEKALGKKSAGSISSKDMIFRADKIDLKSLDLQLEKHLSRVSSKNVEVNNKETPKEVWEIDPLKLEIRYLVAQGTFGTVYRGTYDSQDVAASGVRTTESLEESASEMPEFVAR